MVQAGVGQALDEFGGLVVGEVAVARHDALLGRPGPLGVGLKQLGVVVGLDKQAVGAAQAVLDQVGDKADVAEHAEA